MKLNILKLFILKTTVSLLFVGFIVSSLEAATDCVYSSVQYIQVQDTVIYFYPTGGNWKKLCGYSETGCDSQYSAVLAAYLSGKPVTVRFSGDGYNCASYDLASDVYMIRLR